MMNVGGRGTRVALSPASCAERNEARRVVFETARVAGTSVKMIEAHYGALLDTARESMLERLEAAR
jgi:hypothetical protein